MEKLINDNAISVSEIHELADEILNFLIDHEMWDDVTIYYDGIAVSTHKPNDREYECDEREYIDVLDEKCIAKWYKYADDPRSHFEYVNNPHILSMSFEGEFYEALDGTYGWWVEEAFRKLLSNHTVFENDLNKEVPLFYELGNLWNLSVCY